MSTKNIDIYQKIYKYIQLLCRQLQATLKLLPIACQVKALEIIICTPEVAK